MPNAIMAHITLQDPISTNNIKLFDSLYTSSHAPIDLVKQHVHQGTADSTRSSGIMLIFSLNTLKNISPLLSVKIKINGGFICYSNCQNIMLVIIFVIT